MNKFVILGLFLALVLLCFGIGLVTLGSPGLVDWRELRAVTFESDDWGLAGFVPSANVWNGLNREELIPGHFPPVYWNSTLEDSLMVAELCGIMGQKHGSDGLSAVFQPNYVLSSLNFENGPQGYLWQRYDLPEFPPPFARLGMWKAVENGIEQGVWYPEFHATWHYDPAMRLENALSTDLAAKLTKAGVMLFPGSETARELGPWRTPKDLRSELLHSIVLFQDLFGRPIGSVIAPDYTWTGAIEDLWQHQGIKVIQAKREQRDPTLLAGKVGRVQKFLQRKLDTLGHRKRCYLERNCRLEPAQAPDGQAVVKSCLQETENAWAAGQPAIVETHRINYVHEDPAVVKLGQEVMEEYLTQLSARPNHLPIYLLDREIDQLKGYGVSWAYRGKSLILRNATHSRRLIQVSSPIGNGNIEIRQFVLNANTTLVTF